jgi:hypothetical protein
MTTKKTTTTRTRKKTEETSTPVENVEVKEEVAVEKPAPEELEEVSAPEPVAEPELKEKVEAIKSADPAYVDFGSLHKARGFVDFTGTAGAADHDIKRAYGAFDIETIEEASEEIPAHLRKYIDSPDGAVNQIKGE